MHYHLICDFYDEIGPIDSENTYQPSKGMVLDEAKPNERSVESESYELAQKDFEAYLPSTENAGDLIKRDPNGITVSLGTLGSVKFSPASGEGVVAKVEISLKGAPEYTILYRHASSFGDNEQDFRNEYFPGDYVSFLCTYSTFDGYYDGTFESHGVYRTCGSRITGIVIKVCGNYMYVLTDHTHSKVYKDYWKSVCIHYNCTTINDWKEIYDAWHKYPDIFMDSYLLKECIVTKSLYDIMVEPRYYPMYKYVCVGGDDKELHHTLFWARNTVYSKTERISLENLRNGKFDRETVRYAYRDDVKGVNCDYFMLQRVVRSDQPKLLYPVN